MKPGGEDPPKSAWDHVNARQGKDPVLGHLRAYFKEWLRAREEGAELERALPAAEARARYSYGQKVRQFFSQGFWGVQDWLDQFFCSQGFAPGSEGEMIRLETLIELQIISSSFLSLSSY